ncbi:G-PROTEIN-RECEP-F1-2 domain-containing protein [Aphelenchoides besseyi]|nr:G-PROTEIN-RECEP-F1-2 domain-containing protein [Aphelenchoides besseyi]
MNQSVELVQTINERLLQQKCVKQFGDSLTLHECYELLKVLVKLTSSGIHNCYPESTGPVLEHNSEYYSFCNSFNLVITKFLLPILLLLCLFGNGFNLIIYRLPYFEGSSSVNFLRAKAIANFIFVESRVLEVIHAWSSNNPNDKFESLFWTSRPFVITIANISGTISTWLTLAITIETAICILLPFSFRQLCTRKTTFTILVCSTLCSILLHLSFFFTHTTRAIVSVRLSDTNIVENHVSRLPMSLTSNQTSSVCWINYLYYTMQRPTTSLAHVFFERFYFWSQMFLSIIIPTAIMLMCSALIVLKFITFKELGGKTFSQRRRCVLRLTVSTALSHLLLEGPAVLTYSVLAIKGTLKKMCILNHIINFLSIINATIPFFVFLVCNQQFRQMSTIYLKAPKETRATLMAMALNRSRNPGGSATERSFAGQVLIAKASNL